MSALETLLELERLSVEIEARDGRLRLDAPRGVLTPELLERIKLETDVPPE